VNVLLFFAVLFGILYSIIAHVNNSERKNRASSLQEIPVKGRRSRSVAVPQARDDEAAGFLLLTDNLIGDDND